MIFIQLLSLAVVQSVLVLRFFTFPMGLLILVGLWILEAVIVGWGCAPGKASADEFNLIRRYYEPIEKIQIQMVHLMEKEQKSELEHTLADFENKLKEYEAAFPDPRRAFKDFACRDSYRVSLLYFKTIREVIALYLGKESPQGDPINMSTRLNSLTKMELQLASARAKKRTFLGRIIVGLLSWVYLVTQKTRWRGIGLK